MCYVNSGNSASRIRPKCETFRNWVNKRFIVFEVMGRPVRNVPKGLDLKIQLLTLSVASGCVEPSGFLTSLLRLRASSSHTSSFQNSLVAAPAAMSGDLLLLLSSSPSLTLLFLQVFQFIHWSPNHQQNLKSPSISTTFLMCLEQVTTSTTLSTSFWASTPSLLLRKTSR